MQVSKNPRGPSLKNEKSQEGNFENLRSPELKNPRGPSLKNEKSQEGNFENLKDAGLKKSERSEFEK